MLSGQSVRLVVGRLRVRAPAALNQRRYNWYWLARRRDNVTGRCIRVLRLCHDGSVLAALKTRALSRFMQQAATVVI